MTAPAPTGVALDRVVAVQATWPDGHSTFGSGFLVGGRLVLTAAHCIRDKVTGRLAASVQVVRPSDGAAADGGDVIACTQWDVAVIALGSDAPWQEQLPPLVFARVDRRYSGKLENCEGIGFPLFQRNPENGARETSEVHGTIYPTDGNGTGRLLMRDPLIHPGPMTKGTTANKAGPAAGGSGQPSAWGGLSGALLFHGGMALGVVVDHNPGQGDSALQAVTFDAIAADPDPAARQVADALGLRAVDQLPWAGASRRRTAARRVVGERISAGIDAFRDRVTFRSDLRRLLLSRKYVIISVTGRRGIGKSGVVARVLADFEDENGPDAGAVGGIAYLSTRTGVGILDLARVFHALAALLGGDERDRLETLWGNSERDAVPELLAAVQALDIVVVLDNLDDIQDPVTGELRDTALVSFLGSVCRTPRPPLIVTTSQKPLKLPPELRPNRYGIEIDEGIDAPEAIVYLREADMDGAAGLRDAPDSELVSLVEQVHGVPRGLELLVSLLADDPARALDPVLSVETSAEAALLALVTEGFESLSDVERAVVQHLALANAPVPAHALETILEGPYPSEAVRSATSALVRRRMLGLDQSGAVRLHPVDTDFIVRSLDGHRDERARMDLRLADWLASQRTEPRTWRTSTDVAPQRREFRHRIRAGDTAGALRLIYDVAEFIAQHGEADRVRKMLRRVAEPPAGTEGMARYQHIAGLIEIYGGDLAEAIRCFDQARGSAGLAGQPQLGAKADVWRGVALRHAGRASEAVAPLQDALQVLAVHDASRDLTLFALFELALTQCYLGRIEDAKRTTNTLAQTLRPSDPPEARAFLNDAKALVYLGAGDLEDALSAVEEGIASYSDSPHAPAAPFLINVRGLVHLVGGNTDDAISDLEAARDGAALVRDARLDGLASLNLAWACLLAGDRRLCGSHAQHAATRLASNGVAEADSARALARASEAEDGSAMLAHLREAVTRSLGNPDLYQPSEDILQQLWRGTAE